MKFSASTGSRCTPRIVRRESFGKCRSTRRLTTLHSTPWVSCGRCAIRAAAIRKSCLPFMQKHGRLPASCPLVLHQATSSVNGDDQRASIELHWRLRFDEILDPKVLPTIWRPALLEGRLAFFTREHVPWRRLGTRPATPTPSAEDLDKLPRVRSSNWSRRSAVLLSRISFLACAIGSVGKCTCAVGLLSA